ncbi:MAG: hypothetical protein ACTJFR_09140 [Canibacter sp.]
MQTRDTVLEHIRDEELEILSNDLASVRVDSFIDETEPDLLSSETLWATAFSQISNLFVRLSDEYLLRKPASDKIAESV